MQATVGDRVCVHSRTVGSPERHGVVVEVRGSNGGPPFVIRWDDGHEALFFPGSDSVLELSRTGMATPA
jgi:Domain of unknown function (DUF1918)